MHVYKFNLVYLTMESIILSISMDYLKSSPMNSPQLLFHSCGGQLERICLEILAQESQNPVSENEIKTFGAPLRPDGVQNLVNKISFG